MNVASVQGRIVNSTTVLLIGAVFAFLFFVVPYFQAYLRRKALRELDERERQAQDQRPRQTAMPEKK